MKKRLDNFWKSGKETTAIQADWALEHSCAGRVVNALNFILVIIFLGLWITAFILLYDRMFSVTLTANVTTNMICIVFFGGLVVSLFVGSLAGNFLRRVFWKLLIKRHK